MPGKGIYSRVKKKGVLDWLFSLSIPIDGGASLVSPVIVRLETNEPDWTGNLPSISPYMAITLNMADYAVGFPFTPYALFPFSPVQSSHWTRIIHRPSLAR